MSDEQDELKFTSLKDQFEDSRKELEIPVGSGLDPNKVEDLRERRQKTIEKIEQIVAGAPKGKKVSPKLFFSFYTPPAKEEHAVGDKWVDGSGDEWVQREGYRIKLPKIDKEEFADIIVPSFCPKCSRQIKHWLDKKMWNIHKMCFDCVSTMETELRIAGKYKEYEQQKMMANMRAFYHDIVNGMEDFINSLDATYVTGEGKIERWDKVDKPTIRVLLENDLRLMRENFQSAFGEPLLTEKGDVAGHTSISTPELV